MQIQTLLTYPVVDIQTLGAELLANYLSAQVTVLHACSLPCCFVAQTT